MSQPPRTPTEVADRISQGERMRILFFMGHQPRSDGSAGRGCLSQWWPAPFELDGMTFPTALHHLMWRKAMLFGDHKHADQIMAASHPGEAMRLGRRVRGFDERAWRAKRFDVAVSAHVAKFGQHADLRAFLLGTGDRVLAEANADDPVWGIGVGADDPRARDPRRWPGENLLGFALMDARATLRVSP